MEFIKVFLNVSLVLLIYVSLIIVYSGWKNKKLMEKSKEKLDSLKNKIQVNDYVLFSGGIKGKILSIDDVWVIVEVANGMQLQILINSIIDVLPEEPSGKVRYM